MDLALACAPGPAGAERLFPLPPGHPEGELPTGDFVLAADEVNPVLSELQGRNILVTALHTHMLAEQPRLFFMHFWSVGSPESVGAGTKAALSRVAVK